MAITAFGKFFSWEDSLFFPRDSQKDDAIVRILGHRLDGPRYRSPTTSAELDFSKASGVYLLHSNVGEIVYVGQARELANRLYAHSGDHLRGRWTHFSWFATKDGIPVDPTQFEAKQEAEVDDAENSAVELSLDELEAVLRTSIEPRLNLQGGRWRNVGMYAQSLEFEFVYLREVYHQTLKIDKKLKKLRRDIG